MITALVLFAFAVGFLLGVLALWLIVGPERTPLVLKAQKQLSGMLPAIRVRETEALPRLSRPTGNLPHGEITRMYHAGFPVKDLYKEDTWLL